MRPVSVAALAYVAPVFAAGFGLGTLRVLLVAPALGELAAVALELPVMLALAWVAARWAVARFAVPAEAAPRLAMGALAFLCLMLAEAALASLAFGQSPGAFLGALATPAGALGLAGQAGFAAMPWLLLFGRAA